MKESLYNFLSSCNETFWWSLKYSKDTLFFGLKYGRDTTFWFAKISSNGAIYGAKNLLYMLRYSNDLFFYYMQYMWRNASKETLYYVCLWFKDNWHYITSPEVRSYIIQGLKDWIVRQRDGFVSSLEGPYGIQTFMMFAFLCLCIGIGINEMLAPIGPLPDEVTDLFEEILNDPEGSLARHDAELRKDLDLLKNFQYRKLVEPDFHELDHPILREKYINERIAQRKAAKAEAAWQEFLKASTPDTPSIP